MVCLRSIILVVVFVKNGYVLQEVMKMVQVVDKEGRCIIGFIIKFDIFDVGFDFEVVYIKFVNNDDVKFCFGWYVLWN